VTVISTAPAVARAGEVAVIVVSFTTVKLVAGVSPKLTDVAPVKLVPVIVTDVPPDVEPTAGEIAVTAGSPITLNGVLVATALSAVLSAVLFGVAFSNSVAVRVSFVSGALIDNLSKLAIPVAEVDCDAVPFRTPVPTFAVIAMELAGYLGARLGKLAELKTIPDSLSCTAGAVAAAPRGAFTSTLDGGWVMKARE